ncbi:MAG TPA: PepSY domain-containing protein [Synergistaceae bacterium]|jgi:membrane protein implicated in regulation of membrane protease activity|nr:PepSY domain-containing protein [Synergistaceae bacterium]
MKKFWAIFACIVGFALFAPALGLADDDRLPRNAKKLSEIIRIVENRGYHPVVDVEFDDGRWEIEAYRNGREVELKVHPVSGKILSVERDDDDDDDD